jgi:membrane-associated phospholipid phosphatase
MFNRLVTLGLAPRRRARPDLGIRRTTCRPTLEALEDRCLLSGDMVLRWNQAMLAAVRTAGLATPAATRTAAIVQAAVYEAVNSIDGSYTPYLVDIPAPAWASKEAAAAEAAHDALVGLFPTQAPVLDLELLASLQGIEDGEAKTWGVSVGRAAAQILLAVRAHDGSDRVVNYTPGTDPGDWQPTPPAYAPAAAPQWPFVTPFCLQSASQFRVPPPPALDSPEYAAALNLTRELGSVDSTARTADETEAAIFWQGIAVPNATQMSIWNDIAQAVAVSQGTTLVENARLFALLDLAAGDFAIACWESKYTYSFWRPVTAIRADSDPNWTPLMATPNHPSYPAAHGSLSGTMSTVLTSFFGTDAIPFSVSWEGFPGVTRSFDGFSAAAQEAGMSRIWAGFHWSFDVAAGLAQGQSVGSYVFDNFLLPLPGSGSPFGQRAAPMLQTMSGVATGLDAMLLPVLTDTRLLANGALKSSGGLSLSAHLTPDGPPTQGDSVRLMAADWGGQRNRGDTRTLDPPGGRPEGAHRDVMGSHLDPEWWEASLDWASGSLAGG